MPKALLDWFEPPNVPLVFSVPSSLLIWDAKKLLTGLFGPETADRLPAVGPNIIWSPVNPESPSRALTIRRPTGLPAGGVQNPEMLAAGSPPRSAPTKTFRLRIGSVGFP